MHSIYILTSSAAFSAIYITTNSIIVEWSVTILYILSATVKGNHSPDRSQLSWRTKPQTPKQLAEKPITAPTTPNSQYLNSVHHSSPQNVEYQKDLPAPVRISNDFFPLPN